MEEYKKIKTIQKWLKVIAYNNQKIYTIIMPIRFSTKTIFIITFWSNNLTSNREMNTIRKEIKLKQLIQLQGREN
jgi:hypothetical protein